MLDDILLLALFGALMWAGGLFVGLFIADCQHETLQKRAKKQQTLQRF